MPGLSGVKFTRSAAPGLAVRAIAHTGSPARRAHLEKLGITPIDQKKYNRLFKFAFRTDSRGLPAAY